MKYRGLCGDFFFGTFIPVGKHSSVSGLDSGMKQCVLRHVRTVFPRWNWEVSSLLVLLQPNARSVIM